MKKIFSFKDIIGGTRREYFSNQKIEDLVGSILGEEGVEINETNITPLDLFYIPENFSSDQKYTLIADRLKFEKENLENELNNISRYWRNAKFFFKNYFFKDSENKSLLPREIENLENFDRLEELEKTLAKASLIRKKDRMGFGPIYCALFKIMIAEREYELGKFEGLIKENEYVTNNFFEEKKDGNIYFHKIKNQPDGWLKTLVYLSESEKSIQVNFNSRGKSKESLIAKLSNKPESSLEDVIKDGIGLKFEVEKIEDAENFFPFIYQFLKENFHSQKVIFENISLFDEKIYTKLQKKLQNFGINFQSEENHSSNRNFCVAKFVGEMKIPQGGNKGKMIVKRNFEVQVVLTNNKNESGFAQHGVYKQVQKLSLFSRFFGAFDENYLDFICETTQKETGISKEKIKSYIVNNFLVKINSSKNKKNRYVAKEHYQRWKKAGLV